MSIEAYSRAWASRVGEPFRKLVLLAYADYAHRNGRNSCPSKKTVAEAAECDKRTVQRCTDWLLTEGFLHRGDQSLVEHIRGDRRPVVYDLAMDETTRLEWKAAAERGDTETPRPDEDLEDHEPERGDSESPRSRSALSPRGDGHGVTADGPRGDSVESPDPSTNPSTPLTPSGTSDRDGRPDGSEISDPSAVDMSEISVDRPAGRCARHSDDQAPNCRGCGTTQRQRDEAAAADALARKRAEDRAAAAADRARRAEAARARQSPTTRAAIAEAKQMIHTAVPVSAPSSARGR